MHLTKRHTEFAFPKITYLDAQSLYMDRIFTNLLMLVKFSGLLPIDAGRKKINISDIVSSVLENKKYFENFDSNPELVKKWLLNDFLDVVFRDNPKKRSLVSVIPLHINSYRLRDVEKAKGYGGLEAARQLFTMLNSASPDIIKWLRTFLYVGMNQSSDEIDVETTGDIETDIILRILTETNKDFANTKMQKEYEPPFCIGEARVLADDILKLLTYRNSVPRRVLINYLKTIMSLHLALHTIRTFFELPDSIDKRYFCHNDCEVNPTMGNHFECTGYNLGLVTDMSEDYKSHMASLAKNSFIFNIEQINAYLKTYLIFKKLSEFGEHLFKRGLIHEKPSKLEEIRKLRDINRTELDAFFISLMQDLAEVDKEEELNDNLLQIQKLGLSNFETYIEMLLYLRLPRLRTKHIEMLDTLFMKNSDSGLLRQGRGTNNQRRFYMGSNLLETLVQIAVIKLDDNSHFYTRPILIDEFINFLKNRYGIYISSLPKDKFTGPEDSEALRLNVNMLKSRLRELGFFNVLSDSYKTQIIKPRFKIEE